MKDIAADLGLSIVSISKALRNHPDISEETRARVLKRVEELRYRPNVNARSLVTGRSYLIGLVVPDLLHPFFAEVAVAIAKSIRPAGYSLLIVSCEEDAAMEEQEIEQLVARRMDGLIIAASGHATGMLKRLDEQGEPYLLIDRSMPDHAANFVGMDDKAAGRLATEHLIAAGCRRIAHIRGRDNSTGADRMAGYKEALQAAGLPLMDELVIERETVDIDSRRQGTEAAQRLLALEQRPDGVFCYNDPLAIGVMQTFLAAGVRIPEEAAIVGCGNLHYDDLFSVPLSSIDQQSAQMGEQAGALILALIDGKKSKPAPRTVILEPKLVLRASSATAALREKESEDSNKSGTATQSRSARTEAARMKTTQSKAAESKATQSKATRTRAGRAGLEATAG